MRGFAETTAGLIVSIPALSVASLTVTSPLHRKAIFAALAAVTVYLVLFTRFDDQSTNYFVGCNAMMNLFRMSDFLLLTADVQKELRREGETSDVGKEPFAVRVKWALSLYASLRGVGWTHKPASHIPPSPRNDTKTSFIVRQILLMGQGYLIVLFGTFLGLINPSLNPGGPPFYTQPVWLWPTSLVQVINMYGYFLALYALLGAIGVGSNLSAPKDWPPFFGPVSDAYSVRRCWGYVLLSNSVVLPDRLQLRFNTGEFGTRSSERSACRPRMSALFGHELTITSFVAHPQFVTAHSTAIAGALRIPQGRFRTYFSLFVAFVISGIIHQLGDYMVIQDWGGNSFLFFTLQACAITFEDAVRGLAKKVGVRIRPRFARAVGHVWVLAWCSVTLAIWAAPQTRMGLTSDATVKNDVVRRLAFRTSQLLFPKA
ncbi:hypothetical protein NMY22_g16079 [Coprinellus aureogranulatus]|nr:hypothetical protein NMY22_g16079 [Coprinellus aureogranulatus]